MPNIENEVQQPVKRKMLLGAAALTGLGFVGGVGYALKAAFSGDLPNNTAKALEETTPSPTGTPTPSPTAEPTATATKEAIKPFDCGILSPEDCAGAEYVTWTTPKGTKGEGIVTALEKGKQFKLPETMTVAAEEMSVGKPDDRGYRIVVARKDGRHINILGHVMPSEGIGNVGKEFSGGTVIGESTGVGLDTLGGKYTVFIEFSSKDDLQKFYPEQAKNPPKVIPYYPPASPTPLPQSDNKPSNTKKGITFFDVKPPQSTN